MTTAEEVGAESPNRTQQVAHIAKEAARLTLKGIRQPSKVVDVFSSIGAALGDNRSRATADRLASSDRFEAPDFPTDQENFGVTGLNAAMGNDASAVARVQLGHDPSA